MDTTGGTPTGTEALRALSAVTTSGILLAEPGPGVSFANDTCAELFWRPVEALRGDGWLDRFPPEVRDEVAEAADRTERTGTHATVVAPLDVAGHERWVRLRFNALGGGGWVATVDDITAERQQSAELTLRATHDPLTGLPNRALLQDRLTQGLARMKRVTAPLAVVFLDLDRFKPVNDRYGHPAGDDVLVEVAQRIRSSVRASDTAARVGGDEFVLVVEGVEPDEAEGTAHRVIRRIGEPFRIGDDEVTLSICAGVAMAHAASVPPGQLLAAADSAMYQAKADGPGAVRLVHLPEGTPDPRDQRR